MTHNWQQLIHEIRENNHLLSEKDIDNPIIEQIKKQIDKSERMEKQFKINGPNYTPFKY